MSKPTPIKTKRDLVASIAADTDMTQAQVKRVIDKAVKTLAKLHLRQDEPLFLRGLGSFRPVVRAPRPPSMLHDGVPAFKTVTFKASQTLREVL